MSELKTQLFVYGICAIHGPQTEQINVTIPGHEAKYCMTCCVEWLAKHITPLTPVEAK